MKTLSYATILTILSCVLVIAPFVGADHTDPNCQPDGALALGFVQVGSGEAEDPVPTLYVDDRGFVFGNGLWIYYECNGRDGFQHGDGSSPIVPDNHDPCTNPDPEPGDCVLF